MAGADDVGAALFDGGPEAAPVEARVGPGGGVPAPASRFACRACHGRDGRGGREGGAVVPSIEPSALAAPTAGRPAYDAGAFAAVLREGIDPGGRRLAPLMPRYKVNDAEAAGPFAHLGAVAVRERTGVAAFRRVCVKTTCRNASQQSRCCTRLHSNPSVLSEALAATGWLAAVGSN